MLAVLEHILEGILIFLCWPCLLSRKRSKRRKLRERAIRHGYRPDPDLPPPRSKFSQRRRALTLPSSLPTDPQTGQLKFPQSSCGLLTKLPTELRQQICQECLGGIGIHLQLWHTYKKEEP
jgi:hypothetical protein